MRIFLLTAYFPPDTGSASHLFYELGTALVERGHMVTVITGMPAYHAQGSLERYRGRRSLREAVNGMDVRRVAVPQLPRHIMIARGLWQFSQAAAFLPTALGLPRHDVAMVYSPPLPLGLTAWLVQWLRGTPFILNVQDLFPQSAIDLDKLRNRWLIRTFEELERFLYRRASAVTVHSEGNRRHVVGKGAPAGRVSVVPNWVDTDFIKPGERLNGFRREHGLDSEFVVSFAGVLGLSQDLDVVLAAADLLRDLCGMRWLIVGDGIEKERLQAKAQQLRLPNVTFLPMQPRDRYPAVLHASDVCLTTLHSQVKTPVVPSKIMSAMAAGRPTVAALDLAGDAPQLIAEAQCGLCVAPEDPQALAGAVRRLYSDRALCEQLGRNGRRYAEEHLSLAASVRRYEQLFQGLTRSHLANGTQTSAENAE